MSIDLQGRRVRVLTADSDAVADDPRARTPGPAPYGTAAVARVLLVAGVPLTQSRIAKRIGVTQPRVSQVLSDLLARDLVERAGRRGWRPSDHQRLLDQLLRTAPPSTEGVSTWWANPTSTERRDTGWNASQSMTPPR